MKNFSLLITFLVISILTQGKGNKIVLEGFQITGSISGNADGKKVYLKSSDKITILDSSIIKNGQFIFKGKVEVPLMYTIIIKKNDTAALKGRPIYQPVIPVFVENSNIHITADVNDISEEDYIYKGGYNYAKVKIEGSRSNQEYQMFLQGYEPLAKQRSSLFMDVYIKYLNPEKGKEKGPISEGVGIVTRLDEAAAARDGFIKSFVKENSASPVTLYVLDQYLGFFSLEDIDDLMSVVDPILLNSSVGKDLVKKAREVRKTASGAMYADFAFIDNKGKDVKLSDYLGKGKFVLLEFWASWCGPCRADIPHLKEVYSLYNSEGFEIVSVSMDDDKTKWLKAIDEEKMTWTQMSDLLAFNGEISKLYNFNGIPACLLIDPNGKIVTRNMRGSWMDKKLIELYGNKFGSKF